MRMALIILSGYVSKQGLMNTFQQHQKINADEYANEPALVGALA